MSDIVEKKYPVDITPKEREALDNFIASGLPGIATAKDEALKQATELYFNGASYQEISARTGIKKIIIIYLSFRFNWYETKMQMIETIMATLSEKTEIAHTRSIDLITDLMASLETYYRDIINNYRKSKDPRVLESADMENIKLYMKCMEQVQKFKQPIPLKDDKKPMMGLSLPNGGTLKKIDDNTIEVSNNSSQIMEAQLGNVLSTLAELRREREGKK